MTASFLRTGLLGSLVAASAVLAGCSGGGGGSSSSSFEVLSISVPEGAIWPINKRIELGFSDEVDLKTVIAGSTLQLTSTDGSGATAFYDVGYKTNPATGTVDKTRLVIQPFCPLLGDLSDAGLQPGGIHYKLFLPKGGSGTASIRSINGAPLKAAQERKFVTPNSLVPAIVFDDPQIGPPDFVPSMSFVRLGDGQVIPFVDAGTTFELPSDLPLNLYSDAATQVEFLIQLNQPVDPSDDNLNDDRVRIEYLDEAGTFQPFQTNVELEANCLLDAPGAILRLSPVGILPQASRVRVTIVAGFSDLVQQQNPSNLSNFFADTTEIAFASLAPADGGADEVYEDFLVGGPSSFEDTEATLGLPFAVWEAGKLSASYEFEGSGGPGGTFDWHTPPVLLNFSTDLQPITGGPGGIPSQTIQVVNGVLDVDDLWIRAGTILRVLPGKNPLTIFATGDVIIEGTIDVSGYDAKLVGTLLTPHLPEPGAVGPAGGGTGGTGSFLTSASTPAGGNGDGPFGLKNAGGKGGEAAYTPSTFPSFRRGAGGGGGRFGPDAPGVPPAGYSLTATAGDDGHPEAFSGVTKTLLPKGGQPGEGPFLDASSENDFFGERGVFVDGALVDVIPGELALRWAGYGGGAGGDVVPSADFPTVPFGPPYIDKKGAGGGAGAGQLRIVALGRIIFRSSGRILVRGGHGNHGESQAGTFKLAGPSGGGSGGHVILESATQIDFTDGGADESVHEYIQTYGGAGGVGQFTNGGAGGPGVIQLHVPDANPDTAVGTGADPFHAIRVPLASFGDLGAVTKPEAHVLVPTFGARSKARSKWIPLGAADAVPGGGVDPVSFTFGGTDEEGDVKTTGQLVDPLPPILGPEPLGTAAPAAFVDVDGYTLVLSQPSLQPLIGDGGTPSLDMYLRNPALLTNFQLRLVGPSSAKSFDVASATYSDADVVLRITADASGASLQSFLTTAGGPASVSYVLIPRFFRALTGPIPDVIPDSGYVRILFQATGIGPDGKPIENAPLVDWTPDITEFNAVPVGSLRYFRWEVEFNLDSSGAGLSTSTLPFSLDFLRTPFSF